MPQLDWVAQRLRNDWHVIAPDLRGHGDSQWADAGGYRMDAFIYDLAQLIHQQALAPVTIVAHSMGGNIALRYTGVFPEQVRRLVAIEGLGPSPAIEAELEKKTIAERMQGVGVGRAQAGGTAAAPLRDAGGRVCADERGERAFVAGAGDASDAAWGAGRTRTAPIAGSSTTIFVRGRRTT
ncbi:MAG: alpha/beta fold hydrolase [Rhodospirillales bacterium]